MRNADGLYGVLSCQEVKGDSYKLKKKIPWSYLSCYRKRHFWGEKKWQCLKIKLQYCFETVWATDKTGKTHQGGTLTRGSQGGGEQWLSRENSYMQFSNKKQGTKSTQSPLTISVVSQRTEIRPGVRDPGGSGIRQDQKTKPGLVPPTDTPFVNLGVQKST